MRSRFSQMAEADWRAQFFWKTLSMRLHTQSGSMRGMKLLNPSNPIIDQVSNLIIETQCKTSGLMQPPLPVSLTSQYMPEAASFWQALGERIQSKDGNLSSLNLLVCPQDDQLLDQIADLIIRAELSERQTEHIEGFRTPMMSRGFQVRVNYDLSLEEMVELGGYAKVSQSLTSWNFPIRGEGIVEVKARLVPVPANNDRRMITTETAVVVVKRQRLVPGKIEHFLTFLAACQHLNFRFSIVCLGTSWLRKRLDPYLAFCHPGKKRGGRELRLHPYHTPWEAGCYFLALDPS
jgi:hypothetical protein